MEPLSRPPLRGLATGTPGDPLNVVATNGHKEQTRTACFKTIPRVPGDGGKWECSFAGDPLLPGMWTISAITPGRSADVTVQVLPPATLPVTGGRPLPYAAAG